MKTIKVHTITLDSSSNTTPSAPSPSPSTESQTTTTTTQTRKVTAVTPSKRTRSQITDTSFISSSSITSRPPITEIPITPRSQTSPIKTPLVHIPNPESVERYVKYKQPTAIKLVRLQPHLNLVHIPDTEHTQLPPLPLPSEISTNSSKLYHPLNPLRKPSTSLSNFLDKNLIIYHHKIPQVHFLYHIIVITSETFLHADVVQILQHSTFLLSEVFLHYDLQDNTLNLYLLKHTLQNSILNPILHLVLKPLHYYLQMLKLHFFQETFSLKI